MNLDDPETQAALGEDVERLLANPLVRACVEDHLAGLRAAILDLEAHQAEAFTRKRAGLAAVQEFVAGLEAVAAIGRQARQRLAACTPPPEERSRVL